MVTLETVMDSQFASKVDSPWLQTRIFDEAGHVKKRVKKSYISKPSFKSCLFEHVLI